MLGRIWISDIKKSVFMRQSSIGMAAQGNGEVPPPWRHLRWGTWFSDGTWW